MQIRGEKESSSLACNSRRGLKHVLFECEHVFCMRTKDVDWAGRLDSGCFDTSDDKLSESAWYARQGPFGKDAFQWLLGGGLRKMMLRHKRG